MMLYIYMPKQNQQKKTQNNPDTIFAKDEFHKDVKINQKKLDNI